ncbi:MAG: hypothetical protein M3Q65_17855 [Chloroflexota bacterium]|nr:hypothetical protein [Chloroflexota bacterium]
MSTFLALYRGDTIAQAKLVAVSADPAVVSTFAQQLLRSADDNEEDDPVVASIARGRRHALRLISREHTVSASGGEQP